MWYQSIDSNKFNLIIVRIGMAMVFLLLLAAFAIWRIDNPRAEHFRAAFVDKFAINMDWMMTPINSMTEVLMYFQSYKQIIQQNQELRHELQNMKAWREKAGRLEQENARLLKLNAVKLSPKQSFISGTLITDSGNPFRRSGIINVGADDRIKNGWAVMDGLGLVGRIFGLGARSSRVIFVTDTNSAIPVLIKPLDRLAILTGDNSLKPLLTFVEDLANIKPGDRVFTSGDGGVFPANLLVGYVIIDSHNVLRVQLAADFRRLNFLRVLRYDQSELIAESKEVIGVTLVP